MSTTEREGLRQARFHETSARDIDEYAKERTLRFAKELEFLKGRIIGFLEGNHHFKFMSGKTSTQMMCEYLKCQYLGISSFVRLELEEKNHNGGSVDIWAHHGMGGGKRAGASLNGVEDMMRVAEADIFMCGHDHRKLASLTTRLKLVGYGPTMRLVDRKILLVRTGSFQKGYVPGRANFVSSGGMAPTDLGTAKIELTLKRKTHTDFGKKVENRYVDLHVSI